MAIMVGRGVQRGTTGGCQLILVAVMGGALLFAARPTWAQSCTFCDQCLTDCVCQTDGTCGGVAKQNGSPCDAGNPCTTGDTCQGGGCVEGASKPDDTSCTYPGVGLCIRNAVCQSIAGLSFCAPMNPDDIVTCPDSANKCQPNICDPQDGLCKPVDIAAFCSLNPCSTGACDPATGLCVSGNNGAACNDGNECTANDQCQSGKCRGTAGSTSCVGDCNDNHVVTVDEILLMVNIALGASDVSLCGPGDADGNGRITVDEILTAVNFALTSCPAA